MTTHTPAATSVSPDAEDPPSTASPAQTLSSASTDVLEQAAQELPGMTGERIRSLTSVVITTYALVQSILAARGLNPLPFTSDQVATAIFAVVGVAGSLYNWWTHNAVTLAAYKGKLLTAKLKLERHAGEHAK